MGFQVAGLLAGEILVKYVPLDKCEAMDYRARRGTVVSCPMRGQLVSRNKGKGVSTAPHHKATWVSFKEIT